MPIVKTKWRNCKNANHMEKAKLYDTETKMYSNLTGDKKNEKPQNWARIAFSPQILSTVEHQEGQWVK